MFLKKIKRWGYLKNLSVLKPYDLKIINDQTYYETEEKCNSFDITEIYKRIFSIESKFFHVIHPYNKFKLLWDIIISLLITFFLFYIPLSLSFDIDILTTAAKFCFLMALLIDMILEMNTFYFHQGLEVRNRKNIMKNYLKSYFFPDLLSLIALSLQINFFDDLKFHHSIGLVFFLKIINLIKVSQKMMNRFQLAHEWKGVKNLTFLLFVIILITHLAACGWYYVGISTLSDDSVNNWIISEGLLGQPWYIQYMSSFYWSIVTVLTVGYGDITPQNNTERCFCMFVILFGGMIYPYSINSIGLIIQDIQKENIKFNNTLDIINAYMKRKNINPELQTRIREYLNFLWKEEKSQNMEEENKIINTLSHSLKEELNFESFGLCLKNNPLFTKFFSESTLKKLVNVTNEIFTTPDDNIFLQNQKDESSAIYFIEKGEVKIYSEKANKAPLLLKELKKGEYFGERSFFTSLNRENTAISDKFTTLFMIKQDDFLSILKENKDDYENFMMIKEKLIFSNDYSSLNKKCYCCQQFNHIIEECPKLHFVPNVEKIIKRYNYPIPNERCDFIRNRTTKSKNALFLAKEYRENLKKFKICLKNSNSKQEIPNSFNSNDSEEMDHFEEKEEEFELSEHKNSYNDTSSNKKEIYSKFQSELIKMPSLDEQENENNIGESEIENIQESKKFISFQSESLSKKTNKNTIKEPENQLSHKNTEGTMEKSMKKDEPNGYSKVNPFNDERDFDIGIEKVHSFKNYFPKFNIENIISDFPKVLANEKEIFRKYIKKKYLNLQYYTFYGNSFLNKILEETKLKNKNRKFNLPKTFENFDNMAKLKIPMNLQTLEKKSYFAKNYQSKKQIKSFSELINTIIQKTRKSKLETKIPGSTRNII